MNLRQRPPVFKCDECEYTNSSEVRLKSHKNTYHGNGWTQVKRSHNGRQKKHVPEKEDDIKDEAESKFNEENTIGYI